MWKVVWPKVTGPALSVVLLTAPSVVLANACFPPPDKTTPQYVVGYGSLLYEQVASPTRVTSEPAIPVWVYGFRRGWLSRTHQGSFVRLTELGVVPFIGGRFNGVLFSVPSKKIKAIDRYQPMACRVQIDPAQLDAMNNAGIPSSGQFWIYQTQVKYINKPAGSYPILMSEVDQFLTGCIEQGQRFNVKSFASDCVATTWNWSVHWVNDRYHPLKGRPTQVRGQKVDQLLESMEGPLFERVRLQ